MGIHIEGELLADKTILSASGLHPVLPDKSAIPELHDEIYIDPRFPVVWRIMPDEGILIAANGLTFLIPPINNAVIIKMLEDLNTGQSAVVEQLVAKYGQEDVSADIIVSVRP